jgi:DNA-directed RNA polymerase subunit RPC12/RpoP
MSRFVRLTVSLLKDYHLGIELSRDFELVFYCLDCKGRVAQLNFEEAYDIHNQYFSNSKTTRHIRCSGCGRLMMPRRDLQKLCYYMVYSLHENPEWNKRFDAMQDRRITEALQRRHFQGGNDEL